MICNSPRHAPAPVRNTWATVFGSALGKGEGQHGRHAGQVPNGEIWRTKVHVAKVVFEFMVVYG